MIDYSQVSRGNLTAASIFQDRIVLGNLCLDMNEAQQGQQRLDETEMEKCQRESYRAGREAEIRKKYVCVVNQTPPWFLARLQVMTGALEREGSKLEKSQ